MYMSRASRKMRKNRNYQAQAKKVADVAIEEADTMQAGKAPVETIRHMQEMFDRDDFLGVLQELIHLLQERCYDPEAMYLGAYSYFMQGDYVRAVSLVEDVLHFAPQDVKARILLARICMLEDRSDDGLAIFDYIIEHAEDRLTDEQLDDIKDILDYYAQNEADHIAKEFPHIASFMQVVPSGAEILPKEDEPLIEDAEIETDAGTLESSDAESSAGETAAEDEIRQVMAADITLVEKVRLLNCFAGAHYAAGEYEAAGQVLKKAIAIDGQSVCSLRNMAVLLKDQGQKDRALQVAAQLPETDFLLLTYLKK